MEDEEGQQGEAGSEEGQEGAHLNCTVMFSVAIASLRAESEVEVKVRSDLRFFGEVAALLSSTFLVRSLACEARKGRLQSEICIYTAAEPAKPTRGREPTKAVDREGGETGNDDDGRTTTTDR